MRNEFPTSATINRRTAGAGLALAAMPLLPGLARAGQATPAATPEPVPGGTLRIGVQGDPTSLDPHLTVLAAAGVAIELAYEGLVTVDAEMNPVPALAESWEVSEDGLTWTFALRTNALFHNGRAFVADDVVYSFGRVQDETVASPSASYASGIASVVAEDDATVTITLSAPDASFLSKLCWWGMSIVPKEAVEEHGDLSQAPVGTGPFMFVEYIPNTSLTYRRHEGYWDAPKPYLDGLELLIAGEDTSRTTALVSDTVDLIEAVPHKDIESIRNGDGTTVAGETATNLRWLVFNLAREPFNQLPFRQAVAAALDRQAIIDTAVFGHGEPLVGLYPPAFWAGYQGEVPAPDPDGAKALLESVTLPEGFAPSLLSWSQYDFLANTAIVVQEQLKQVGIEAELEPLENATYLERFFGGDFDIAVMGAAGYLDPNDWLEQSLMTDGVNNAAGYSNPDLDALVTEGLATLDQAARVPIYQEAQQIVIDDLPWISLYTSNTYEGLRDRVQGFEHYLSGGLRSVRGVWLV